MHPHTVFHIIDLIVSEKPDDHPRSTAPGYPAFYNILLFFHAIATKSALITLSGATKNQYGRHIALCKPLQEEYRFIEGVNAVRDRDHPRIPVVGLNSVPLTCALNTSEEAVVQ